jgi:vitamin B12 transporter
MSHRNISHMAFCSFLLHGTMQLPAINEEDYTMQQQKRRGVTRHLSLILALPLALAGVSPGSAADTDETFNLGEVVVSAKTGGVEATQAVHEVTAEDIQARNARTLKEAIELVPGLYVRTGGDGVPRIDIRGMRTRHVVLLLDGVPVNSAVDQQFDSTLIPADNIAKIKVTVGPSSVLYGQGGLAGVINIITKKGGTNVKGNISYEAGDRQDYLFRGSLGGSKNNFDYYLSANAEKRTSYPLSDDFEATSLQGTDYRQNSDHERNNLFGSFGFQATKDLHLALTMSYVQGEYGKPASTLTNADPFASNPKFLRIDSLEGFSAQLAADYTPTGPFSLRAWAYHNRMDQHERAYDDATYSTISRRNSYDVHTDSRIQGLTMQPKVDLGRGGVITASLGVENNKWENDGYIITNNSGTRASTDLEAGFDVFSLSTQYELSPVKNLGLVFGYGHYWQNRSEVSDDDFSVMAGAHYDFPTGTRLKTAFQRNVRFPTLEQLYATDSGNPDLTTEISYLYQVGIEQKLPGNSLISVTGFRNDVKDYIEKITTQSVNNDEYRFYGVEVATETRFVDNLTLRASYSYLDSKDKSDNATRDELQYRPKNTVTFEGWYDFPFGLTPYISVQHVANQVTYDRATNSIAYKLDNFTQVNLKVSQKLLKNRLNVYLGVDNLFDENYETSYGYPRAGRFIYGGVGLSI